MTLEGTRYRYYLIKGGLKQFTDTHFNILIAQQYDDKKAAWSSFHYLLSTDTNMGGWTMLFLYRKRWKIETFYKFAKEKLGLASSRALKSLGLLRFVFLLYFAYTFLTLSKYSLSTFLMQEIEKDSYYQIQSQVIRGCKKQMITWVYIQGQRGYTLDQILMEMHLIKKTA